MTQKPWIIYRARNDATPETEIATLASIYSFVLRCAKKSARDVTSSAGDDAKGTRHDSRHSKYTE
jgi:hypothetical protein